MMKRSPWAKFWVWASIVAAGVSIELFFGRTISLTLDSVYTVRLTSMPIESIGWDRGFLLIGSEMESLQDSNHREVVHLEKDLEGRIVLSANGQSFVLGAPARSRQQSGYDGTLRLSPCRSIGLRMNPMGRDLRFAWEEMPQQLLD